MRRSRSLRSASTSRSGGASTTGRGFASPSGATSTYRHPDSMSSVFRMVCARASGGAGPRRSSAIWNASGCRASGKSERRWPLVFTMERVRSGSCRQSWRKPQFSCTKWLTVLDIEASTPTCGHDNSAMSNASASCSLPASRICVIQRRRVLSGGCVRRSCAQFARCTVITSPTNPQRWVFHLPARSR